MAKVYITRCIVKKDGKSYQKGSVIEGMTDKEIKQGLAEHWLEAVGNDEGPGEKTEELDEKLTEREPSKPPKNEKPGNPGKSNRDDPLEKMIAGELIAEAAGLGLQADDSMTEEALREMIREARKQ
jgi:hypothetical protein